MDKTTKIVAIAIVAIMIVAAVGVVLMQNKSNDTDALNIKAVAQVYGNANMDYTVDDDDIKIIEDLAKDNSKWNRAESPYADANADGKIDQSDVDLVKKIVKKQSCTIYYQNYWGEASPLNFPIVDPRIAVTYWQQGEEMGILGLWDKIVVANLSVKTSSATSIYDHGNIEFVGTSGSSSSTVKDDAIEVMMEKNVNLIIGSCYDAIKTAASGLKDQGIQSIFLWHAGTYCLPTILTLGVLLGQEDNAQKYVSYCEGTLKTIEDKLQDTDKHKAITLMMYETEDDYIASNGGITTYVNQPEGAWILMSCLIDPYTAEPSNKSLGRSFFSEEWYMQNGDKFEYIIDIEESTGLDGTQAKYNSRFEKSLTYLDKTDAYAEGKIVGTTYSFGGFAGYSSLLVLAWMLYPDLFTEEAGLDAMQDYYDKFTNADIDVRDRAYYYTGDEYEALYLK